MVCSIMVRSVEHIVLNYVSDFVVRQKIDSVNQ